MLDSAFDPGSLANPPLLIKWPATTPQVILGSALVGFIDAENNSKITSSGGNLTSYADVISGAAYALGSGSAAIPIANDPVTGRQIFNFQGASFLDTSGIPAAIPTGADPGDIFCVGSLGVLGTAATFVSYGGNNSNSRRTLRVNAASNLLYEAGNGSASIAATSSLGNTFLRGTADGTTCQVSRNEAEYGNVAAVVPSTSTVRVRIGASSANTAVSFLIGKISAILFTNRVCTAAELNSLAVWAGPRIWG
jgi:hypothetical protein